MEELKSLISNIKTAVVIPHKNPDGDAMGSCLALTEFLINQGVSATLISPTGYPDFLQWMKGNDEVLILEEETDKQIEELISATDAVFCLDFNDLSRIDRLGHYVNESSAKKVMIDHHLEPKDFADITISQTNICSTCQIVFSLIEDLFGLDAITESMGENLYTGIVTDTGSFKYRATESNTHRMASEIMKKGVDTEAIHRQLYDNDRESRLRLLGHLLLNNMTVLPELKTAYFTLTLDDMNKFDFQKGDNEGVVNYALSMKGIEVAVFFKEADNNDVKISFRSKGSIAVNELSRDNFNGGGHRNAAGGIHHEGLESAVKLFEEQLPKYV